MPEQYLDKHSIISPTLISCCYDTEDFYPLTIRTKDLRPYFGKIADDRMILNLTGLIVLDLWNLIPMQFPLLSIEAFDMMPNHIHGILIHDENHSHIVHPSLVFSKFNVIQSSTSNGFPKCQNATLNDNVLRAIRWFKGACTYEIRKTMPEFEWQS